MAGDYNQKDNQRSSQLVQYPSNILQTDTRIRSVLKNTLSDFDRNLGEATRAKKGIPLYYGSEFQNIIRIAKLFSHNKEKTEYWT